jgi:hypothetical protein
MSKFHYQNKIINRQFSLVLLIALFLKINLFASISGDKRLVIYPAPESVLQNTDFSVKVRMPGQIWQELPEYIVKVDEVRGTTHAVENASMSYFDFAGEVEISVTYNKGDVRSARIRPLSYGIKPEINGKTITFKLTQTRNLSVEVNGDIFHNLHLFANPIDQFIPEKKDTNLIYFGPGIHKIDNGKLKI